MSDHFDPYHVWLGIPPEEQPPNHYRLLGLRLFEANPDVISNALDQRRAHLRSVQAGKRGALSQQLLNEVTAAGVCLLDEATKKQYDDELRAKFGSPQTPADADRPAGQALPSDPAPVVPFLVGHQLPETGAESSSGNQPIVVQVASIKPVAAGGRGAAGVAAKIGARRPAPVAVVAVVATCALLLSAGGGLWLVLGNRWPLQPATATPSRTDNGTTTGGPPPRVAANPVPTTVPPQITPADQASPPAPQPANAKTNIPSSGAPATPQVSLAPTPRAPQPADASSVANPSPSPTPPMTAAKSPPPATAPPPAKTVGKPPVPAGDQVAAAVEQARTIYADQFKQATRAAQKAALAKEIQAAGEGTKNDPIARYVLLDLARKVYVQAGEVSSALAAARLLEGAYDIRPQELVITTLEALDDATLVAEQRTELARSAAKMADGALDDELFERADKLSAMAAQSAARQRDPDLRREITQRRNQIVRIVKQWNEARPSLEKLKTDAADTAANLVVGKFYCLTLDDFDRGLKHLAESGDLVLSPPARLDLVAKDGAVAARYAAAQAWEKAIPSITDRESKLAVQRREKWLLDHCVLSLSGLDKVKAEKRLEELKEVGQTRTRTPNRPSRSGAARPIALIGRVRNGTTDAGLVVTYEHGYKIAADDFARMLTAAGLSGGDIHVELVGVLTMQSARSVSMHHVGSSSGATHTAYVDNNRLSTVGAKDDSRTISLTKGPHPVRWEIHCATGNWGTAQLEFLVDPLPSDASDPHLPLVIDKSTELALRSLPTRAAIHFGPSQ